MAQHPTPAIETSTDDAIGFSGVTATLPSLSTVVGSVFPHSAPVSTDFSFLDERVNAEQSQIHDQDAG